MGLPLPLDPGAALATLAAPAEASPLTPVTLADVAAFRACLDRAQDELDHLVDVAGELAVSDAARLVLQASAIGVRLQLQLCTARVDGIAACLRAAQERRRAETGPFSPDRPPLRKAAPR